MYGLALAGPVEERKEATAWAKAVFRRPQHCVSIVGAQMSLKQQNSYSQSEILVGKLHTVLCTIILLIQKSRAAWA